MLSDKKNIGLYFGSFNPIHNGHLAIANYLLENTGMDEVWFVVSPQSPFKKEDSLLEDDFRYSMVLLAIKGNDRMRASNIEFGLPKPSYTINTLNILREKYPDVNFSLILGADNLEYFNKWKNYQEILANYHIYVYPRSGSEGGTLSNHSSITWVNAPLLDISSTDIREMIKKGTDVSPFLSEKVLKYIAKMGFYK